MKICKTNECELPQKTALFLKSKLYQQRIEKNLSKTINNTQRNIESLIEKNISSKSANIK
ncbi:hypothetical protein CER18_03740 [Bartonella tribocorum]|uniref:Uncharacterized protein n=1 Tax=Bartonella tribocorum TaxID=85701 RepID=A0A2M6UT13_9HYPH|nr:hypothetical protein CER18_03740 [Bartonella tribocorum]